MKVKCSQIQMKDVQFSHFRWHLAHAVTSHYKFRFNYAHWRKKKILWDMWESVQHSDLRKDTMNWQNKHEIADNPQHLSPNYLDQNCALFFIIHHSYHPEIHIPLLTYPSQTALFTNNKFFRLKKSLLRKLIWENTVTAGQRGCMYSAKSHLSELGCTLYTECTSQEMCIFTQRQRDIMKWTPPFGYEGDNISFITKIYDLMH